MLISIAFTLFIVQKARQDAVLSILQISKFQISELNRTTFALQANIS